MLRKSETSAICDRSKALKLRRILEARHRSRRQEPVCQSGFLLVAWCLGWELATGDNLGRCARRTHGSRLSRDSANQLFIGGVATKTIR